MRICGFFVIIIINLCFKSFSSFSKSNPLRWVPPRAHEWKHSEIPDNVKWYWENRWAKASFLPGCHDENHLKIIPVYFWPGETVVLPCRMCQMAYLMNGRMKRWGYSEDIDEFLLHPKQFVRVNELWQDVENTKYFDQSNVPDPVDPDDVIYYPHEHDATNPKNITSRVKEPPRYWQNDGKLTIFSADVRSQGVYFCFDEFSRKQTSLFFVLSAMLPPVHFTTDVPTRYTDHCGSREDSDYKLIAASHNWRYHFYPMGDMNPPPTCAIDERDKEECVEKYPYLRKEMWPKNFDDECSMDRCRARLVSPEDNIDLFIELRWDAWTSCKGDKPTKRREGHCYLVRGRGSINIEAMSSDEKKLYSWIRNIETIFDRKPFDIDGIRLFSSTLVSAILDKPKITGCYNKKDDEKELYEKYDQVWRKVLLPTLGVPATFEDEADDFVHLGNPFEACIRYVRMSEKEYFFGTHSTQVDYC